MFGFQSHGDKPHWPSTLCVSPSHSEWTGRLAHDHMGWTPSCSSCPTPAPRTLPTTSRTGRTLSPRGLHREGRTPFSERKQAAQGQHCCCSSQWNETERQKRSGGVNTQGGSESGLAPGQTHQTEPLFRKWLGILGLREHLQPKGTQT